MANIVLEFEKERDTKNTVRYQEVGDVHSVGTLYIQKHAVKELGNPEKITVEIKAKK